ncbi:hypothetical protein Bsp3421_004704 [Burkholderia sp. FERM BP-3421]|jgi:hypothetical protein|uniref:hypothetical protein n=1 Tax=Burkholderia sp. FERM BP-3421 TaxID=1494466 RepID=UPI0023616794|nr:hypothetical protein [Burkholderia sp. FERM BP-3421]WDD94575.1 hypothetical protein Bsp3421_004704 [Burkholderia sp. FERM BP-3421]
MRKTIAMYWPLAIVVPLAAAAYLHAAGNAHPREPLAIHQASAELARAVSFGLVGDADAPARPAMASDAPIAAAKTL